MFVSRKKWEELNERVRKLEAKVSVEPSVAMMMHLAARAARDEKTIPEVIIDMIEIDMHRKGKGK